MPQLWWELGPPPTASVAAPPSNDGSLLTRPWQIAKTYSCGLRWFVVFGRRASGGGVSGPAAGEHLPRARPTWAVARLSTWRQAATTALEDQLYTQPRGRYDALCLRSPLPIGVHPEQEDDGHLSWGLGMAVQWCNPVVGHRAWVLECSQGPMAGARAWLTHAIRPCWKPVPSVGRALYAPPPACVFFLEHTTPAPCLVQVLERRRLGHRRALWGLLLGGHTVPFLTGQGGGVGGRLAAPAADGPPKKCFQLAAPAGGLAFPPRPTRWPPSGTPQRAREVCPAGRDWVIADGSRGSRASDACGLPASSGLRQQVAAEREETAA